MPRWSGWSGLPPSVNGWPRVEVVPARRQWTRWATGLLLGLVAGVLLLPHVVNLDTLRQEVERKASEALGRPVTVGSLNPRLLPLGVTAGTVSVDGGRIEVARIDIALEPGPLLQGEVVIPRIGIEGVQAEVAALALLGQAKERRQGAGPAVRVDHIEISDLLLRDGEARFGPYALAVQVGGQRGFRQVELTDAEGRLRVTAVPAERGTELTVVATDWKLPTGPALHFERLTVAAQFDGKVMHLKSVQAEAYAGTLSGDAKLDWSNGWRVDGRFTGKDIDLEPLLQALGREPSLAGRLTSKGHFSLRAAKPELLGRNPSVDLDFDIRDGVIYKADLEKAARELATKAQTGGKTPFQVLTGHVRLQDNRLRVDPFTVQSAQLEAAGRVSVTDMTALDGRIDVGLKNASAVAGIPLQVGGTVEQPSIRLTNAAIAGAAAGTGVLGPGVGTAIGLKAGQFFEKLKGVFGSDDADEP